MDIDAQLKPLRENIDDLDAQLVAILRARWGVVKKIGEVKNLQGITPLQNDRKNGLIEQRLNLASDMNGDFIKQLFELIHEESLRLQGD